jgi:hypothetical protein
MQGQRSVRLAELSWLLGALLTASCASRTTPLPPPEVLSVSAPDASGLVSVTGYALEGAAVGVVNDATLIGVITSNDTPGCARTCMFHATVAAKSGDNLRVWQFFDIEGGQDAPVPDR